MCEVKEGEKEAMPKSSKAVCANMDKLSKDVMKNTAIKYFCESKTDYICDDPLLGPQVCNKEKELNSNLCNIYPDRCKYEPVFHDRCTANWPNCLLDVSWDFCSNFPELCQAIPKAVYYKYQKPEDLDADICKHNKDLFCGGKDSGSDIKIVCDNIKKLPQDILYESSFRTVCEANPHALCYDPSVKNQTCTNGEITTDYCKAGLFPEKCTAGAPEYDACASDILSCMLDPEWRYCDSFPELCNLRAPPVIKNQWDIDYALCADPNTSN